MHYYHFSGKKEMFQARRKEIQQARAPRKWYVKATRNEIDFPIGNGFMNNNKLHFVVYNQELKLATSKTPQPKLIRNLSELASSEERHRRMSGSVLEDSSETKKLFDKGRTHSFILELEQGSQEALKQRSVGKFDRLSRKELHIKERKEKERSLSNEHTKHKLKQEKKTDHQADESQQKDGIKVSSEEKGEKKPKIKSEKKSTGNTREGKTSVPESIVEEGPKYAKKVKSSSTEAAKAEKDKEKEKDKIREKEKEKDKSKEREKQKGEKTSSKSDFKLLQHPDSAGSSEDRSDMDPGSDSSKKKDKQKDKEVLKRSKSHSDDRQVEKSKSKTDSKDGEKEKTKADQDSQKPNKSETDKDQKRVKSAEKGKSAEKSKSKSKEETKTLSLSKTDKKVQSSEVRSASGGAVSKPEMTKEKKKDASSKEQRKVSEEPSHEKSENKSTKKKLEKKEKVTEKKDDSQEEKKEPKEDKMDKSDKSHKSSVSSLSLETEELPKKQLLLQDTSTDSDPVTTTITTSFSDDTCDALSDITPEPPEGETQTRLSEIPAVPAEADALLTLMDVCTSAEAQLPPESHGEDVNTTMVLQDADMKMKEAALTLLSMDPDSTVSNIIIHSARDKPEVNEAAPQPMETPAAHEEQRPPVDVQTAAQAEFTAAELSPAAPQPTAEVDEEKPNTAGT